MDITFGLDLTLIATIGGMVFVLTEAAKKKLGLIGIGTQIFAVLATGLFTFFQLRPVTGDEWLLGGVTALIAWLAPDGIHQFFKKKKGV